MRARAFAGLLIGVACLLASGCDGRTRATPTAPTAPATPATTAMPIVTQPPTRPVDPRFDERLWGQLVFDRYEHPNELNPTTWVLDGPMNVYIKTTDELGRQAIFGGGLDGMIRSAPQYGRELSGRDIIGRVESGPGDPGKRMGWIRVLPLTSVEGGGCGRAWVGANPGEIELSTDHGGVCLDLETFAHELGHALGFFHVDPDVYIRAVMRPRGWFANSGQYRFSPGEVYHARLAYEVGRWKPSCGWPYGPECARRQSLGFARPPRRSPVVVD